MSKAKKVIKILGMLENEFVKIATVKQGIDGSIYYAIKWLNNSLHWSYHPDGTISLKLNGEPVTKQKLIPLSKLKEFYQLGTTTLKVSELHKFMELTNSIKKKDDLLIIDLRELHSFKLDIILLNQEKLHLMGEILKKLKNGEKKVRNVYISTITNPNMVFCITKQKENKEKLKK